MILVSGTKRSGTSMWMQILVASGMPHIGSAFPGKWEASIKDANPKGFYESKLRNGIFYATNPDPETGAFLAPRDHHATVVKVFIPGLVRSDLAYIDRVLITFRHWREYVSSLERLYELEEDFFVSNVVTDTRTGEPVNEAWERSKERRKKLPPALEWWFEVYDLVRDVVTRRYPTHFVSYDRLLADPEREIGRVVKWVGRGNLEKAVAAVDPSLRTRDRARLEGPIPDVDDEMAQLFDDLFTVVHAGTTLSPELIGRMNVLNARLEPIWRPERARKPKPAPAAAPEAR